MYLGASADYVSVAASYVGTVVAEVFMWVVVLVLMKEYLILTNRRG